MAVDRRALGSPDQGADDGVGLAWIADFQALRHRDEALAEASKIGSSTRMRELAVQTWP
jgi:hypothetical protein